MNELDEFMVHTITVRTLTGAGGMGTVYADPVVLSPTTENGVLIDDQRRLVRGQDAAEVISETTIYDIDMTHAALFTAGSLVTLPSLREATVLTVAVRDSGDLDLPDHIEIALT